MPYDFTLREKSGRHASTARGIRSRVLYGESIETRELPRALVPDDPLAVFTDTESGARFGLRRDSPGTLFAARSGGGKTNAISLMLGPMILAMRPEDRLLIFDSKGDYIQEFGNLVPERRRYVLGCGEEYRDITSYWNLFGDIMAHGADGRLVYTRDSDDDAQEMAYTLLSDLQDGDQPIFTEMAAQLLRAILVYFMRKYGRSNPEKLNNRELKSFLKRAKKEDIVALFREDFMEDQRSVLTFIEGHSKMTEGVQAFLVSLQSKFPGPFGEADPGRECSMRGLIEGKEPAVIFLEYDVRRGKTLSPVYSLLIDFAMKYALGGRERKRRNLYVVLDEWKLLTTPLRYAANALSFGRSQGVRLIAGLQNISVLEDVYGEAGARDLLAGFQNIIAFSIVDKATRQWFSECMGENYVNESFTVQNISVNERRHGHCVEDWDIQRLGLGEGIVNLPDSAPFFFHFPRYRSGLQLPDML